MQTLQIHCSRQLLCKPIAQGMRRAWSAKVCLRTLCAKHCLTSRNALLIAAPMLAAHAVAWHATCLREEWIGNPALHGSALRHRGVHGAISNDRNCFLLGFKIKESKYEGSDKLSRRWGETVRYNTCSHNRRFLRLRLNLIQVRRHGRRECMGR